MVSIGDKVVYGAHGVCEVLCIQERIVDRKQLHYYVLEPVNQTGTKFYVPVHNAAAVGKMRPVLSRQMLDALLRSPEARSDIWVEDENLRKQVFRDIIVSGDRMQLLQMVNALHRHKQAQLAAGRKFHLSDENFLRDAQKLLSSEFSVILGVGHEQVEEYVLAALNED